jgi:hypothetical protein
VAKIKSRGYWQVIIRPANFNKDRLESLGYCKDLIEQNHVFFRGWDYPHIDSRYGITSGNDWVESSENWTSHIEYWRFYRSAQFFHLFSCIEDWEQFRIFWSGQPTTTSGYGLEFICTLYTITEIFELAARLAKKKIFDDSLKISITLNGMKNRRLVTSEIERNFFTSYICNSEKIEISKIISFDEIVSKSREIAIDNTINVYEHFNLFKLPRRVLEEEQDRLVKGKF